MLADGSISRVAVQQSEFTALLGERWSASTDRAVAPQVVSLSGGMTAQVEPGAFDIFSHHDVVASETG